MEGTGKLEAQIRDAFALVERPSKREIAPHDCLECDEIRCDLAGKSWDSIEDQIATRHAMDLPLLSAEAKMYFLPIWLLRAIADPNSVFAETLIYNLSSDFRWDPSEPYSKKQWKAVTATLEYLLTRVDEFSKEDVAAAIRQIELRPN